MSLEATIGRIGQIIQFQQQLADPAAAAATGSTLPAGATAGATTGAPATTGSGGAAGSFATMLAGAQDPTAQAALGSSGSAGSEFTGAELGTDPTALSDPISSGVTDPILGTSGSIGTTGGAGLTGATGLTGTTGLTGVGAGAPAQVQQMVSHANSLLGKPYVWGGGHGDFGPQPGYDCSGFVSSVLHAGGYLSAPQDTQTLPSQPGIESGPGQYVTIYDRTDAGSSQDHVIIDLNGQFYESGGGHGAWGGGGGVEKIGRPSASYLASFNRVLHPEGL
jgi:cell wall-associated NlpC family hydrolase